MALDWKKGVSLSTLTGAIGKKVGGGSNAYPSKTTMNLYQGESQSTNVGSLALTGILLAVGIALFVKFGVLDQLAALAAKQAELAETERTAQALKERTADYNDVKETYDSFMARFGGTIDTISILDMVEQRVMSKSVVTNIVLSENTLTLTLYNVPLNTVGDLAKDLETQDMVSRVNVSTASTHDAEGQNTTSTLVVTLAAGGEEE